MIHRRLLFLQVPADSRGARAGLQTQGEHDAASPSTEPSPGGRARHVGHSQRHTTQTEASLPESEKVRRGDDIENKRRQTDESLRETGQGRCVGLIILRRRF